MEQKLEKDWYAFDLQYVLLTAQRNQSASTSV